MTLKAYAVTEENENTGGIVFAEHAIVARRIGADRYNDSEFSGLTCRRAPWADEYHETGVPAKVMIGHGWHFECHGCGSTIDEDWLHENDLPLDRVIGFEHSSIFCHDICEAEQHLREVTKRHHERRMIETMTAWLLKRFPGVEIATEGNCKPRAYARQAGGSWSVDQAVVSFKFPGMKIGPASYRFDHDHHIIGPVKPHIECCHGDHDVFVAWAATVPA
jgi:hypothetical protein